MFVTRVAAALVLLSLLSVGLCLADAENEDAKQFGETTIAPMLPDGMRYDFGTVQRGPVLKHTFRVVNTGRVPLQIISLHRTSGPHECQLGRSAKTVLQPGEMTEVEVFLDTKRFRGPKTVAVWLTLDNGRIKQFQFIVTANAQDELPP